MLLINIYNKHLSACGPEADTLEVSGKEHMEDDVF